MDSRFHMETRPKALSWNVVQGEKYRITMLTDGLVRLEYCEDGAFEDRPTQMALNRDFPKTEFRVIEKEDGLEIITSRIHLLYDKKGFSENGLSIQVLGGLSAYWSIWHYSEELTDLRGTARTLDMVDGEVELEHGIMSRYGFSVLDDSQSQVICEDGWVEPRKKGIHDLYFWGYGHDYKECLKDFYYLCGKTPMVPRYALGNWWSRYYKYTEDSYLELMDRFEKENLPFTIAVIDMNWHLVDVDPSYGSGWTGYTWDNELFPDPERFLRKLHERGLKTTLNVHPADGVRAYEDAYEEMAKALGVNAETGDPVNFDAGSPEFVEAYLKYVHHPLEKQGVDFWWVDWQQGGNCKIEGLDPLWILNHFHFLDSGRNGKRPMTFSRYAGPGSHRYPVGFSGDTITTWESLNFQPYFTVNAANIGYGWWSHDIGGHMMGYKNDEMMARWVQFGIFSPVMRLHSSFSEFNGKEPWRFKKETECAVGEALRMRHHMMPYLYTMNYRSWNNDLPVVMPMYYEYPEKREAYDRRNQYYFGNELVVAPITSPRVKDLNVGKVKAWIPEGMWYDIFTGLRYQGNRVMDLYRDLNSIPVLAKAGAILPFTDEISSNEAVKNPDSFHVHVYSGADGSFILYEDDNETNGYMTGNSVSTAMVYKDCSSFSVLPAAGSVELIPGMRSYTVEIVGVEEMKEAQVRVTSMGNIISCAVSYELEKHAVVIKINGVDTLTGCSVLFEGMKLYEGNDLKKRAFDFLNQAEIGFGLKEELYSLLTSFREKTVILAELGAMELDKDLNGVLVELITAF
ncbi:MAG: glycoside hydrolase family 31 protein [Lacrimispora sp.]